MIKNYIKVKLNIILGNVDQDCNAGAMELQQKSKDLTQYEVYCINHQNTPKCNTC